MIRAKRTLGDGDTSIPGIISSITDTAGGFVDAKINQAAAQMQTAAQTGAQAGAQPAADQVTYVMVGLGVVVVASAGAVIYFMTRKKRAR